MTTKLSDVIVPEIFRQYVILRLAELVDFWGAGIVQRTPELDEIASGGGQTFKMPFWNDLDGNDEVWDDENDITPGKIDTGQDIAHILTRARAWEHTDLAAALAGDDPARVAADLVADYWSRRMQAILIAVVKGVFADNAANFASDMIHSVATEDGDNATAANKWSRDAFVDAIGTLGDHWQALSGIGVHSTIFSQMQKQKEIEFVSPDQTGLKIPYFDGLRVIVDDSIPWVAGGTSGKKFDCYLFGQGAIGWGEGSNVKHPVEMDRDSLGNGGKDILVTRRKLILHPRGVKFDGSPAGPSPTNTELAAATNWTRVYDRKHVRLAKLVVNG